MDISYQLYSSRNARSLSDTFATLRSLGYSQVEGYGGLYHDPASLALSLKKWRLSMPTAHVGYDALKDVEATLTLAEAIGVSTLFCPSAPQTVRTNDDSNWDAFAESLALLCDRYRSAGIGFGWHNHDFEFVPTKTGRIPMEIILEASPNIEWEFDLAWAVRGRQDPLDWITRYGMRITAVHVKDIARSGEAEDEDGWADVGHGIMNWQELYTALRSSTATNYYVLEHDKPSDPQRFARRSMEAIRRWK